MEAALTKHPEHPEHPEAEGREEALSRREAALADRERALQRREAQAEARQRLIARGMPEALAAFAPGDEAGLSALETAFFRSVDEAVSRRLAAGSPPAAPAPVSDDELTDQEYYRRHFS